jgi:putative ABC transport system permease protein
MDPLTPWTYYIRHKRQTLLILALVSLMTLGVSVMVRLPDSFIGHMAYSESYVTRADLVSTLGSTLDPGIVAQIRSNPDVDQVIPEKGLMTNWPPISGASHIFGVTEADLPGLLATFDLGLKEGRLPRPHTNEIVLSEMMAQGAKVGIGDEISDALNHEYFGAIPSPLLVVGILEDVSEKDSSKNVFYLRAAPPAGFVSYEYVSAHEGFAAPWASGLVVIAKQGHQDKVDAFLETDIKPYAEVRTRQHLMTKLDRISSGFHLIFLAVDLLVAAAIALVMGMVHQITISRRLSEFGLLHALGNGINKLTLRLIIESGVVSILGWLLGLGLSWAFFNLLRTQLYEPYGIHFSMASLTPIWFTLPIPVAVIVFTVWNTRRTFRRFDAVSIIERSQLSEETDRTQAGQRSMKNPLASRTYYLRHRRRSLLLILTISLMILGVAFPAFVFGPMIDSWVTLFEHLRRVSVITPLKALSVDPGIVAQIRNNEEVDDVIPAMQLQIGVEVPPMANPSIPIYGVSERDLQTLIDLYDTHLENGRLPQPYTNEIVVSKGLAQNRGWQVGDKIGRAYDKKEDDELPTEMVVTGILASSPGQEDLWTGFASLGYLSNHEFYTAYPMRLLVVPKAGCQTSVEAWLEASLSSDEIGVRTFTSMERDFSLAIWAFLLLIGIIEAVLAIVAAIALAILSYILFIQRQDEFGILHAIGHRRSWLVLRTAKESSGVVIIAWLLSVASGGIGLTIMKMTLFTPKGMSFNIFNPAPWVYTFILPLTVILVSSSLISRTFRKFDPVTIIERRS